MTGGARRCFLGAALGLSLSLSSASAGAIVVSEDPFEGNSLDIGGAVRSYNFVLAGGPLTGPLAPPDASPAGISLQAIRPKLELERGSKLGFVAHNELLSTSSTLPRDLIGNALSFGAGRRAPVWLPLQWTAVNHSSYQLTDRVDWIYLRYTAGPVTLKVGRQPVTIGRGQIWTPEDLLGPFSPLQLNTEFKPGVDALRADWTLSENATLFFMGTLGKRNPDHRFQVGLDGSAALTRFELTLGDARLGTMAGMVRGDVVAGLDFFVDLGHGADLHGEGTVTYIPQADRRRYGRHAFNRALFGTTAEVASDLHITAEAYFNGSGAPRAADYVDELSSPRLAVGEVYNVGRLYAGVAADWQIHPLLHGIFTALANLEDPSTMLAPELDYNVATNALLVLGAFIPIGKQPRYTASSLTARSEFGLYPELYHLDAKLYF